MCLYDRGSSSLRCRVSSSSCRNFWRLLWRMLGICYQSNPEHIRRGGGVLLVLYFKQCVSYRFYIDDHYVFTRWVSMPRAYFFFNMLLAEFGKLKDLFWCILGWKNLPFVWFFSQISFPPGGGGVDSFVYFEIKPIYYFFDFLSLHFYF